jgi:hypothetical protein
MQIIPNTKYDFLESMFIITKKEKKYYHTIIDNNKYFDTKIIKNKPIFCFEYNSHQSIDARRNQSKELKIGWIDDNKQYHITIIKKIVLLLTQNILKNFEKNYNNLITNNFLDKKLIEKYCMSANNNINWNENKKATFIYVDVEDKILEEINFQEYKIDNDIKLGLRNLKDGYKDIIFNKPNEKYCFNPYDIFDGKNFNFREDINYSYNYKSFLDNEIVEFVNYFNDEIQKKEIEEKFYKYTHTQITKTFEFEYLNYNKYGTYNENNAIIVKKIKNKDVYIYASVVQNNQTCAGFCCQINCFLFDSLEQLWNELQDYAKNRILEQNYTNIFGEEIFNVPYDFDSDSDSSLDDY